MAGFLGVMLALSTLVGLVYLQSIPSVQLPATLYDAIGVVSTLERELTVVVVRRDDQEEKSLS